MIGAIWQWVLRRLYRIGRPIGRQLTWLGTYGTAIAAGIVAGAALLQAAKVINDDFWAWAAPLLLALNAFVLIASPAANLYLERRTRRTIARKELNESTHILLLQLAMACPGLAVGTMCVRVWHPEGLPGNRHLAPVTRARIAEHRSSGVVWVKGKGTVGLCWQRNQNVFSDLTDLHAGRALNQHAPDELAMAGLTAEEFERTDRYWTVLALPLRSEDAEFIGCVAIDCSEPKSFDPLLSALRADHIGATVGTMERLLRVL